ncbi:hypothetical protein KUV44_13395 [Marinobacter daepoensis]|uniref:Lipoprotein n=1 Tax=Marinobacter daepoensis TaxID=262077 RepID=A0ABS3BIP2_9GAMM|nr:hypothetical protein [Marinobacter daepoensis]MBN7771539.1 hypothetical protein [Marinobacter daepoensis]MBY6080139.1 hypothetical protein [Marinobacter daepoensis]
MKHLLSLSVPLLSLALAGCGDESDDLPVDGREFDGVSYSERAPYQGRVIDGYLKEARVWLDIDGNGQYTSGPVTVDLGNGNAHVLENGEPTVFSVSGGRFSLDVSPLDVDSSKGADLDPRDYPLYALAIPGQTLEERVYGDEPVSRAYVMSASPGVTNITPLTTLARFRSLAGQWNVSNPVPDSRFADLDGINLWKDYILASDDRAHAYARALARFMASQIPDDYNDHLVDYGSDGREAGFLPQDGVYLLGYSLVQNADKVIATVDAAASGGHYGNVDTDALVLPEVDVEVSNPRLLVRQKISARSTNSGTLPTSTSNLGASAELSFEYSENGQLLAVASRGCLGISLPELARLFEVQGYLANLKTQWLPSASLSPQSAIWYDEGGVHERLEFSWNSGEARLDTVTTCHQKTLGVTPGGSELDGVSDMVWAWDGQGKTLVESVPGRTDDRVLTVQGEQAPSSILDGSEGPFDLVMGYRYMEAGRLEASVVFSNGGVSCEPAGSAPNDTERHGQYVTRLFPFSFASDTAASDLFGAGAYEYDLDERNGISFARLLKFPLLDRPSAALPEVSSPDGAFQWQLYYPGLNEEGLEALSPERLQAAYLTDFVATSACGDGPVDRPARAYATVEYEYQTLSEYLLNALAE